MSYQLSKTGCYLIESKAFHDDRGYFEVLYHQEDFKVSFPQTNLSFSKKGVVRGFHFQKIIPQGKLVRCLQGHILDVVIDLRTHSPTYKCVEIFDLKPSLQCVYIPTGFAHGFIALSDSLLHYLCTQKYHKEYDAGIHAFDEAFVGKEFWENQLQAHSFSAEEVSLSLSDKDSNLPRYHEIEPPFVMKCSDFPEEILNGESL